MTSISVGSTFAASGRWVISIKRGEELRQRFPDKPWTGGSLVNMSSVHGAAGFVGHSVYAGTKGAINAFSRELAVELCPLHIRVNVMAPGSIEVASYFKNDPNYTARWETAWCPGGASASRKTSATWRPI